MDTEKSRLNLESKSIWEKEQGHSRCSCHANLAWGGTRSLWRSTTQCCFRTPHCWPAQVLLLLLGYDQDDRIATTVMRLVTCSPLLSKPKLPPVKVQQVFFASFHLTTKFQSRDTESQRLYAS